MNFRNIYLSMVSAAEARERFLARFAAQPALGSEEVFAADAVGRVLAEPVYARFCSPSFHAAAMDGIAVPAEKTFGATEKRPVTLAVGKDAFYVNTGARIPPETDAVIMIEDVLAQGEEQVSVEKAAYPWQHVRKVGEDIVATEMLFARSHLVSPTCVNALMTAGAFRVRVKKKPRVMVIPTGDELIDWQDADEEALARGGVVESNSYMLMRMVEQAGGLAERAGIVPDRPEALEEAVKDGVERGFDLVLVLAGSSAGSRDHTKNALSRLGEVLVHGVKIMPGKPVILADVGKTPVVGVPGYPVSAIVCFCEFVEPLLCRMQGARPASPARVLAVPTRKIPSRIGMEEVVRVKLGQVGETLVATPLPRGAGSITSFTRADGLLRVPENLEGVPAGEPFHVSLLPTDQEVNDTIVLVGSHDNTLDVIADLIKEISPRFGLSSAHVGSMGGLLAVKKGICHAAGTHLLDVEDGSYNLSYIKRVLPGVRSCLVHLVGRDQGFLVAPGNPKNIKSVEDLALPGVRFINRQAGSGTRVLLDYLLTQKGVDPKGISGYGNEEFTHMNVAAAVFSGAADAGLGIMAAARALGLDFVPVACEQYDLLIPEEHYESDKVRLLLSVIKSDRFIARATALGGYHFDRTGDVDLVK